MNFCWKYLNDPIIFDENHPAVLIIENPKAFRQALIDITDLVQNGAEDCGFYEEGEPIAAGKRIEVITDPFSVNPNQRKILNALYGILEKRMWDSENFIKTNETISLFQGYLYRLTDEVDYPIVFSDGIEGAALFKAFDMQLDVEAENLLEQLDNYMSAAREFLKKDVFVFVNLHAYLVKEELEMLYRSAAYRKNKIFLIEAHESAPLADEKRVILDEDLCQLDLGCSNEVL